MSEYCNLNIIDFFLKKIWVGPDLPGLPIGYTPVVHPKGITTGSDREEENKTLNNIL
jgi:hypothetical protein